MKNVRLLLSIFSFSVVLTLQAQEQPKLQSSGSSFKKTKEDVDSNKEQKTWRPLNSGQRSSSEDRAKKQKTRQVMRHMKEEKMQSEKAALANGTSEERIIADKLYESLGYAVSAEEYLRLDGKEKTDQRVIANMANSYRLNNQTLEAEYWYSRIVNYTTDPEDLLHFAQMLQINGKCEDATRWFKAYAKQANLRVKKREIIESCDELDEIRTHLNVRVRNLKGLNTGHLDFSPIPYQNGVVFTSTRGEYEEGVNEDKWTKDNFTDLYFAEELREGVFKSAVPLTGDINAKFHDGVATFTAGDRIMIFTRNNYDGISSDGVKDLKIYESVSSDDNWIEAKELPFNSDEFTSCHPTISVDGQRLYFASNRPGGYGGLDIYASINEGGEWSEPINLGPEVNTGGNELFPFIGEDETLYYSSNGWRGLGGLDLFKVKKANKENESTWGRRENMGRPFNSQKDDFGFYMNRENKKGYLSSNRDGGSGGDDIYSWTMEGNELLAPSFFTRKLCVKDGQNGAWLAEASVIIDPISNGATAEVDSDLRLVLKPVDESKEEYLLTIKKPQMTGLNAVASGNYKTDDKGLLSYKVKSDNLYRVSVNHEGYEPQELTISGEEWIAQNKFCVSMNRAAPIVSNSIPVSMEQYVPVQEAPVSIEHHYIPAPEQPVVIEHHYTPAPEVKETIEHHYIPPPEVPQVVEEYYIPVQEERIVLDTYTSINPQSVVALRDYFLGDPETEFEEGQVLELKNIYYDFDKATIRSDASVELDRVVSLLLTYPSMEIELGTHTDSRGSKPYNSDLSKRRAEAVVRYIIGRGIEPHRLTSVGYGEYKLINDCVDNVDCKEAEHQANRRTEITIKKIETPIKDISR